MHPHFRRLVYPLTRGNSENRFSASAGRESQGGGLLQLALDRLSPAERVLHRGKSARAGFGDGCSLQKIPCITCRQASSFCWIELRVDI